VNADCRIGTSGWVYHHWQGVFYPADLRQSQWLSYYSEHFDTVEINSSFYRLPSEAAFDHWRDHSPPGFRYAVKANRFLTHIKRLKEINEPLERFLERARRLGDKLGPILWQLPPRWHPDLERLEQFASRLPSDLIHVFEFRDPHWFIPPVGKILEQHKLTFCIFDMPGITCPHWITSRTIYLRFHGSTVVYGGLYGKEGLLPWRDRIHQWMEDGCSIYIYFNNDAFGFAIQDAKMLIDLVARSGNH
jgi:uncharacterized protein YecE (DUF72 family)